MISKRKNHTFGAITSVPTSCELRLTVRYLCKQYLPILVKEKDGSVVKQIRVISMVLCFQNAKFRDWSGPPKKSKRQG